MREAPLEVEQCQLLLPLGYSQFLRQGIIVDYLRNIFGAFDAVGFETRRLTREVFEIKTKLKNVPNPMGGLRDMEYLVSGIRDDHILLPNGVWLVIKGFSDDSAIRGLYINFHAGLPVSAQDVKT